MTESTNTTETQTPTEPEDDGLVEVQKRLVRFHASFSDGSHGFFYAPEDHQIFGPEPMKIGNVFFVFFDGDEVQHFINPAQIVAISAVAESDKVLNYKVPKENADEQNGTEATVLAE